MRKILSFLFVFIVNCQLSIVNSSAQSPQAIPYQAVARDNSGNLIANQNISIRFSIHDGSAVGALVYRETQSATTNVLGLFNLNIGQGTIVNPPGTTFSSVNWASGNKFIQIEMDATGGSGYVDMGTQQMLSVPYSLYSANAASGGTPVGITQGGLTTVSGAYPNFTISSIGDNWGTQNVQKDATLAGSGISGSPLGIAQQSAALGNVLKWNGSSWAPAADNNSGGTVTSVIVGTGLSGGTITTSGTISMPNVGTAGTYGSGVLVPVITTDAQGRVSSATTTPVVITETDPKVGTLTPNKVPKWGSTTLTDGIIYDNGTNVGISNTLPAQKLDVNGTIKSTGFLLPTGAAKSYVLTSDSTGNGTWGKSDLSTLASSVTRDFSCMGTVGIASTGSSPNSIAVSGNFAYVVDVNSNDLRVYDISNPAAPVWKNTAGTSTGTNPYCVAVSGNFAYVVDAGSNDFRIYDITNPVTPVWKNNFSGGTATGSFPISIAISGNYAYVLDNAAPGDLRVYDITNPVTPVWKNTAGTSTGASPVSVAVSGNYAYVVDENSNDLRVYDISNPVTPVWKNTAGTSTGAGPVSVAVSGNYAYVVDDNNSDMRVYDISNPVTPVWKNTSGTSTGSVPFSIAVSGNYAYVADENGNDLRVFDISNPVTPVLKNTGGTSTGTNPISVAVSGNYAYVVDFTSNDLRVINLLCNSSLSINTATDAITTTVTLPNTWAATGNNISNSNLGNVGIGTLSPTTKLQVSGGIALPIRSVSSATTLTNADYTLICTGSTVYTITLPAAASATGWIFNIVNQDLKNVFTSVNYIPLTNPNTPVNTIIVLTSVLIQSDGTSWWQVK